MKSKTEIIKTIEALKDELKRKYKVKEIGLFGSVVRSEQNYTSDIDILVSFDGNIDLFDFVGLGLFLEEKLGQKIDIVPKDALREELKEIILKEVSYL